MHFREDNNRFLIVLELGDEIISSLTEFAERKNIEGGFFEGIGALNEAEIGWFDLETKQYIKKELFGQREILSLKGNIARDEAGKPIVHCHILLGARDFTCEGGHLFSGRISVTCEIFLEPTSPIIRGIDDITGLKLWKLA